MKYTKNGIPIHEIMSRDRFSKPKTDKWQELDNGRFRCPRCKYDFAVDTWNGKPWWKVCPVCVMPKEIELW